jgi:hypothetical protein
VLRLMRVLVLVAAGCVSAVGLLVGLIGILLSLASTEVDPLTGITFSVSFLILTTTLGFALAWHAWRAIQGLGSIAFRPRRALLLVVAFVLDIAIGQALLSADLLPELTFPLFHVTAAVLPPLTLVALVGQTLDGAVSWRDIVLQISSGSLLSIPLAFALEIIVVLGLLTAAFIGVAIQRGGQELLQTLTAYLRDPVWLQDPSSLAPAAMSPAIMAAVLVVLAGFIPLIEEGIKTVGVGLLAYRKPGLPQFYLWGLACGAGFALTEALFNTTSGLQAWALVLLLRVGATLMHCFTGALMGLGWYSVLARNQWKRGLGLYTGSVAIHSLWNGLTVWMAFASLAASGRDTPSTAQALAGFGTLAGLALLALLTLGAGLGLTALTIGVRRRAIKRPPEEPSISSCHHQD